MGRARQNWEGILYAIVTIFLLERVRTAWNRIERAGADRVKAPALRRRQEALLVKASLLYALPLLLPVVKYIYRSIEELSWSVPGLVVLKNTIAFFIVLAVTEIVLVIVVYNLLRVYIERMNTAAGFFRKLGRNVWDGSVQVVQAGVQAGARAGASAGFRAMHGLRSCSSRALRQSTGVARQTWVSLERAPRAAWSMLCQLRRGRRRPPVDLRESIS